MDSPLGILFLKKAELYNLVERLDEQADKDSKTSKNPNTWPIERNIFEWSYEGHKHLGTPLIINMLKKGNKKLGDWGLVNEKVKLKRNIKIS